MFVVFGWGHRTTKEFGRTEPFRCDQCSNRVRLELKEVKTWFTLFFIPVIPLERHHLVLCPICLAGYELSSEQFAVEVKRIAALPVEAFAVSPSLASLPSSLNLDDHGEQAIPNKGSLEEWVNRLDDYLTSIKSSSRHIHFRQEALFYGHASKMEPDEFVRTGYRESMTRDAYVSIINERQEAGELLRVPGTDSEPPIIMNALEVMSPPDVISLSAGQTSTSNPLEVESVHSDIALDSDLHKLYRLYASGAISEAEFKALRSSIEK